MDYKRMTISIKHVSGALVEDPETRESAHEGEFTLVTECDGGFRWLDDVAPFPGLHCGDELFWYWLTQVQETARPGDSRRVFYAREFPEAAPQVEMDEPLSWSEVIQELRATITRIENADTES